MYVVRNKKTKATIHMVNSQPGVDLKPEEVFSGFDAKTMELGRYHEQNLPEHFTIKDGVVVAQPDKPAQESVEDLKAAKLQAASWQSFELRMKLIPDHEVLNAALGLYDEKRTRKIRETVRAFRDEYKRFEAALEKA